MLSRKNKRKEQLLMCTLHAVVRQERNLKSKELSEAGSPFQGLLGRFRTEGCYRKRAGHFRTEGCYRKRAGLSRTEGCYRKRAGHFRTEGRYKKRVATAKSKTPTSILSFQARAWNVWSWVASPRAAGPFRRRVTADMSRVGQNRICAPYIRPAKPRQKMRSSCPMEN